jgi:hypothetical protein
MPSPVNYIVIQELMKRTPDAISKKKQDLSRQIDGWKYKIHTLNKYLFIEGISNKTQEIAFCEAQIKECLKNLSELYGRSKPGHITFKNIGRLRAGVS